jgi:hypothetical protein
MNVSLLAHDQLLATKFFIPSASPCLDPSPPPDNAAGIATMPSLRSLALSAVTNGG